MNARSGSNMQFVAESFSFEYFLKKWNIIRNYFKGASIHKTIKITNRVGKIIISIAYALLSCQLPAT